MVPIHELTKAIAPRNVELSIPHYTRVAFLVCLVSAFASLLTYQYFNSEPAILNIVELVGLMQRTMVLARTTMAQTIQMTTTQTI